MKLFRRVWYLVNRRRLERDLSEEMAAHREMMAQVADSSFGAPMRHFETSREIWGWGWLDRLAQDLRYGLRLLRKSRAFTLTAVLVLALGMGVNLTALRMLLLAAAPIVRDPDTLVEVARWFPDGAGTTIAYPVLSFYAEHSRSFRAVIAAHQDSIVLGDTPTGSQPENVTANFVTANYFQEEAPPVTRGRAIAAGVDDAPASEPAVLLSQRFWEHRLGAAPDIIGQTLKLNGKPVRIIGVLGNPRENRVDLWMALAKQPYVVDGSKLLVDWTSPTISGAARLNPGVSVRAAEQETSVVAAALHQQHPEAVSANERLTLTPFSSTRLHPQEMVAVAMGVALVLLILITACANLGTLLLARGIARQAEIRTRLALGASRARVVRQLLTESTLLATGGSIAAWFLSALVLQVFQRNAGVSDAWALALDWRVTLGTLFIALLAAISFGLAPALRLTSSAPGRGRSRSIFLASQVGASCVLLMISGQLARSFGQILNLRPGFDYQNVITISPGLHAHGYDDAAAKHYLDQLCRRLASVPGVEHTSLAWLPVWGNISSGFIDRGRKVAINRVDSSFVDTFGLHLTRGRSFGSRERDVALVSESFARRHWPREDPIGKRLTGYAPATVVGVVAKAGTFEVQDLDAMGVYYPILPQDYGEAVLEVRVNQDPANVAGVILQIAATQDPKVRPAYESLRKTYDDALGKSRTLTSILGLLGLLATLLAAIGLAGLTGYTVSQRTREIGLRIALGAPRTRVVAAVLRPMSLPVIIGIASGFFIAAVISAVLRNNLSSLRPADPFAYLMAIALFAAVVAIAISLPTRRAVRIQPAEALRHE